jgi:hypothetical protein
MIRFRKRAGAQLPRLELAAEIAETLFQMGGAAHRDTVIDAMAAVRRSRGQAVDTDFRLQAVEAFAAFSDDAPGVIEGGPLFTLPFGPNSLRWAMLDTTARYGIAAPVVALPERRFAG